jgi:hypothetical protein
VIFRFESAAVQWEYDLQEKLAAVDVAITQACTVISETLQTRQEVNF